MDGPTTRLLELLEAAKNIHMMAGGDKINIH